VPKYCYRCKECDLEFETRHGIKERLYDCDNCENSETLQRIPQLTNIIRSNQEVGKQKAGSLVKEYIEENKKLLKEERKQRIEYNE
jgi:predicted nucleic acid-binding Zn ribbon protein